MTAAPTSPLAKSCLDLAVREEAHLRQTVLVLLHVRAQLVSSEPQALHDALQQTLEAQALLDDVRGQRERFRQSVAAALKMTPAAVTLRGIANHLPPQDAEAVRACRRRLHELARDVEYLNHGNARIVWGCLDFVRQAFAQLLGSPLPGRYAANGLAQTTATGSTWQRQG